MPKSLPNPNSYPKFLKQEARIKKEFEQGYITANEMFHQLRNLCDNHIASITAGKWVGEQNLSEMDNLVNPFPTPDFDPEYEEE